MKILAQVLGLFMAASSHASEIVAWKVPLPRFTDATMESGQFPRLASAPEASPFFHENDELWDLGKLAATKRFSTLEGYEESGPCRLETTPPLEWAVWNATTGTLVTKSDWNGIWQLVARMKTDELPRQCRATLEMFTTPVDGSIPTHDAIPAASLATLVKSGVEGTAEMSEPAASLRFKMLPTLFDDYSQLGSSSIELEGRTGDQPAIKLNTIISFCSGEPLWIARDFDGREGIDIRCTITLELFDGTPLNEAILLQSGGKAEPLFLRRTAPEFRKMGGKFSMRSEKIEPGPIIYGDEPTQHEEFLDPFAESKPARPPVTPAVFKNATAPKELQKWFPGPFWDMRKWLADIGINIGDRDFAGLDLRTRRIFILSDNPAELDKFSELRPMCCTHPPALGTIEFQGAGQTKVAFQSGQVARIERVREKEGSIRLLEMEPTIGETGDLLDLRLKWCDGLAGKQPFHSIQGGFVMKIGSPLVICSGSHPLQALANVVGIAE